MFTFWYQIMTTITREELVFKFERYKVTLIFFFFFYYQIDAKLKKKPEISHSLVISFEKKQHLVPFSEAFSDYTSEQVSGRRNNYCLKNRKEKNWNSVQSYIRNNSNIEQTLYLSKWLQNYCAFYYCIDIFKIIFLLFL